MAPVAELQIAAVEQPCRHLVELVSDRDVQGRLVAGIAGVEEGEAEEVGAAALTMGDGRRKGGLRSLVSRLPIKTLSQLFQRIEPKGPRQNAVRDIQSFSATNTNPRREMASSPLGPSTILGQNKQTLETPGALARVAALCDVFIERLEGLRGAALGEQVWQGGARRLHVQGQGPRGDHSVVCMSVMRM